MEEKKRKTPSIRFQYYSDDWEQRKLGDMVEFFSGLTYSPDNVIKQPGTLVLRSSNVQNGEIVNADNVYVDNEVVNSDNVQVGDIAVVVRNGSRSLIGKHAAIKYPMKDTVIGAFMTGIRSDTPSFTNALLDTQQFETEIAKNLGATINQITTGNFKKMTFNFPEIDERLRIGDFFNQLDNTIALHQSKLELLKNSKQTLLQKMFPKSGESIPELRFPGFTDDWEQRKLEDISDKVTEKNKNNEFTETLTNSAEFGIINQREFFDKDISNEKNLNGYYIVREDDFVYNPRISNYAPVGPIKRNKLGRTGVMSPLYYVFRPHDIDKKFLEYFFGTTIWHKFMKLNGDSGARADRFAIKDSVFKTMPIPYPSIEEQKKVGKFFDDLNDTIALHQQELVILKQLKQTLLNELFI